MCSAKQKGKVMEISSVGAGNSLSFQGTRGKDKKPKFLSDEYFENYSKTLVYDAAKSTQGREKEHAKLEIAGICTAISGLAAYLLGAFASLGKHKNLPYVLYAVASALMVTGLGISIYDSSRAEKTANERGFLTKNQQSSDAPDLINTNNIKVINGDKSWVSEQQNVQDGVSDVIQTPAPVQSAANTPSSSMLQMAINNLSLNVNA